MIVEEKLVDSDLEIEANIELSIVLNGEPYTLTSGRTVNALLQAVNLAEKRLAVEVNEEIVPRSQYADYKLKIADKVEIVVAIGGG